jgi:hypothetical protein
VPAAAPAAVRRTADALLALTAASVPLSITGVQTGVIALGVLAAVATVRGWGVVRRTPLDGVLALFYGVLACTTLASGRPLEAGGWDRLWIVLAYFVVFWWVRDRAHVVRLVRLVAIAGAIAAAYGILQHYTGIDLYRALVGRATIVRPREPGMSGFAVVGFFRNWLTFAHTMLFPLAWTAAMALRGRLLGAAAPAIVVAIVFSTARGVWLAMLAVVGVLAVVAGARRGVLTLGGLALAAALAFLVTPDLRTEASRMFSPEGANTGRVAIYRTNLDIIHDHPVLGLGFGRYRTAARPYYDAHPYADRRSHAHSNYLHIAAESGLLGLAAFGLLFATALRLGWRGIAGAPDADGWAAAAGAWAGLVGFLVGGITQYNFGDNEVAAAMWFALAVLMRCRER